MQMYAKIKSMKANKSLPENNRDQNKVRLSLLKPAFNPVLIKDIFAGSLSQYLELQKEIQKKLEINKPALEYITRIANQMNQSLKSLGVSVPIKEAVELQEKIKSFVEKLELPTRETSEIFYAPEMRTREYKYQNLSEERIAETVFKKIMDKVENKSKTTDALFKKISVVELPKDAKWEYLEIKFENKFDISIYYRDKFIKRCNNEDLGLVRKNTKDQKHDKQWEFLEQLAIIGNNSNLATATTETLTKALETTELNLAKIKENLSKKLKNAFGINENPFLKYDAEYGYRLKFKLKPEPLLRDNKDPWSSGGHYIDNFDNEEIEGDIE